MISEKQVKALINTKLEGTDVYLVDVSIDAANRISIEIDHNDGVSIQRCVEVSRHVENALDRDTEDFELQVSSPGLDKGFKVLQQYHKNEGKEIEVKLKEGRKLKGILLSVQEDGFTIEIRKKERIEGKRKSS